jgi:hypothetical protein
MIYKKEIFWRINIVRISMTGAAHSLHDADKRNAYCSEDFLFKINSLQKTNQVKS